MTSTGSPNILLIFTDQHRCDGVSAYPGAQPSTPNLAKLAAEGTTFDRAYTTCPICAPARASLQTGLYPAQHGMTNNIYQAGCTVHELPDSERLLGKRLQEAGYATGFTGKWHLGWGRDTWNDPAYMDNLPGIDAHLLQFNYPEEYRQANSLPSSRGYNVGDDFPGHGGGGHNYPAYLKYLEANGLRHEFRPEGSNHAEVISGEESTIDYFLTERSREILEDLIDRGQPWFHTLAYWGPHEPCYVPSEYLEPYRDRSFEEWASFSRRPQTQPRIYDSMRSGKSWSEIEEELRYYYAHCDFIDDLIGRLLSMLEARGQLENTVVIFTADHGDGRGCQGNLHNKGTYLYEEVTKVPLIIHDPQAPGGGRRAPGLCNLIDVHATILDYAGVTPDPATQPMGTSLKPVVRGESDAGREQLVVQTDALSGTMHSSRLLRRGDWAYIFNIGSFDELYNLADDPDQLNNLVESETHQATRDSLRQHLLEELRANQDMLALDLEAFFRVR